ncbi:hypothetical protein V8J82_22540 [Gymnodinialimonas sp. 2305UL16-5]|uniref:hypothetical protein n=1 Tax=Gymnodinialimonas mytili TaxID=3126503 RepID=UPI00309860F8
MAATEAMEEAVLTAPIVMAVMAVVEARVVPVVMGGTEELTATQDCQDATAALRLRRMETSTSREPRKSAIPATLTLSSLNNRSSRAIVVGTLAVI